MSGDSTPPSARSTRLKAIGWVAAGLIGFYFFAHVVLWFFFGPGYLQCFGPRPAEAMVTSHVPPPPASAMLTWPHWSGSPFSRQWVIEVTDTPLHLEAWQATVHQQAIAAGLVPVDILPVNTNGEALPGPSQGVIYHPWLEGQLLEIRHISPRRLRICWYWS